MSSYSSYAQGITITPFVKRSYTLRVRRKKKKRLLGLLCFICPCLAILGAYKYAEAELAEIKLAAEAGRNNAAEAAAGQNPDRDNPYRAYPNYIPQNLSRYEAYGKEHPALPPSGILWQVNANLDREFYTEVMETDSPTPLLVNKHNKLPEDFVPELVEIKQGHLLTPGAAEAFTRMRNAALSEGYTFDAASGYRSAEKQRQLYDKTVSQYGQEHAELYIARPGFSEHQTGRAVDITGSTGKMEDFGQTPEQNWITKNCEDYGFIIRYTAENAAVTGYGAEPWHLTFVGREISTAMKSQGITSLEEYAAKYPAVLHTAALDDRKIVVIDPGHGDADVGAIAGEINEKDINLDLALRVKKALEAQGIKAVMTREDDSFLEKEERAEIANRSKAAAFVSIHQNSYENKSIRGLEIWYNDTPGHEESLRLAKLVHTKTLSASGAADRGLRPDSDTLVVLREAKPPAILVEAGYLSNQEELRLLGETGYRQALAEGIAAGVASFLEPKILYLTFDDGPSAENTPKILDHLKEKNVKATFFIVGEKAEKNPELIKRIVAEGHSLGIHCYSHKYTEIYASTASYIQDFQKASDVVCGIVGLRPKIYRFPGGSINAYNKGVYKEIIAEMNAKGYVYYDWNASMEDAWKNVTAAELVANTKKDVGEQKNVILLAHDAYPTTAEALPQILELLSGYTMQTIGERTPPVQFGRS